MQFINNCLNSAVKIADITYLNDAGTFNSIKILSSKVCRLLNTDVKTVQNCKNPWPDLVGGAGGAHPP